MARGVWTTPWQMTFADSNGKRVTVSVPFNESTLAIVAPGLTGNREPGCLYDRCVVGRVEDGTRRVWLIPAGDFGVTRQILANRGFSTIVDISEAGFTLGVSEAEV